jgi:exoribonuclease R
MSLRWVNLVAGEHEAGDLTAAPTELRDVFDAIRAELKIPENFSPQVIAEARMLAAEGPAPMRDETAVPFRTVGPWRSRDLDQALYIERRGQGYRVRCAVADVTAFVSPGGELDAESFRRGQVIYAPDHRTRYTRSSARAQV